MDNVMRTSRFLAIYIINISHDPDSPRPALVMQLVEPDNDFKMLEITHQNPINRDNHQKYYYPIKEWQQANLDKRSWIYVKKGVEVPTKIITSRMPIGKLSSLDQTGLFKFMVKNNLNF